MDRELLDNDLTILPISTRHADCVSGLPFHHRDPFDQLIIAQSLVEEMPLLSVDVALDVYGVKQIW